MNSPITIYYSGWNGTRWYSPIQILQSPEGNALHAHAVADLTDRILLIWSDSVSGNILFSWANANNAQNPGEWADPIVVPAPLDVNGNIDIAADDFGNIYVVYAIRLNEGRGVYFTKSSDTGQTWSEPVSVFDAVGAKWDMLDDPHLALNSDGNLSLIWTRYPLPGGTDSLGLFYSTSDDHGNTWSNSGTISNDLIQWSWILDVNGTFYCFWQGSKPGFHATMYVSSPDEGQTWSQPQSVSSSWEEQGKVGVTKDPNGNLQLIQITDASADRILLKRWMGDGNQWVTDENMLPIDPDMISQIDTLSVAISPAPGIGVIISGSQVSQQTGETIENIIFTRRSLDLSAELPVQSPVNFSPVTTITPTLMLAPEQSITQTPSVTGSSNLASNNFFVSNSWAGLFLGAGLSFLLIVVAFGWWWYTKRWKK